MKDLTPTHAEPYSTMEDIFITLAFARLKRYIGWAVFAQNGVWVSAVALGA
jgi:hypothetical protein